MLEEIIKNRRVVHKVDAAGFRPVLEDFGAELRSRGYAETTISFYEHGAIHLAFWVAKQYVGPSEITKSHVVNFLSRHLPRCQCPFAGVRQHQTVRAAVVHFEAALRNAGYLTADQTEPDVFDFEVQRFDNYLRLVSGLQDATRTYRRRYVREFLREFFPQGAIKLSRLVPKDVVGYLSKRASQLKPASTKVLGSSLRSYFRFLRLHGECDEALIRAVPAPASWRMASLPRVLTDDEVAHLLTVFDRKTLAGSRDYAITRCLTDLGLRAGEVARLRLEDIDWRKATVRIVGSKSRRDDELPLTTLVGQAVASYLRRRGADRPERQVFLRVRPPIGKAVTRRTVADVIIRAAAQAGMATIVAGTRILRPTTATRMLNHGASIKEVADVLRHRSLDTTAIYTKVNLQSLSAVAMPWPQDGVL
jgi:integrase/recombinase XerD